MSTPTVGFKNEETAMTALVVWAPDAREYRVVLRDDDSGNSLPVVKIFKEAEHQAAVDYAKNLVGQ